MPPLPSSSSSFSSFSSLLHRVAGFSENHLRVAAPTMLVLIIFTASILLCVLYFCIMLCCAKRRKGSKRDLLCKKGLFALMLARLDEFDSLTPLIVSPAGAPPASVASSTSSGSSGDGERKHISVRPYRPSSSSPPPPRRQNGGKTLLVPLTSHRYRGPPVPILGTPDSRVTTFETGTTKSCTTIPELDEVESPSQDSRNDLLSIDRTSYSCLTEKKDRPFPLHSSYNLIQPAPPPQFHLPAPAYGPPSPPSASLNDQAQNPETSSDSLGSANCSLASGSPVDTTRSFSDSFCNNGEEDRAMYLDNSEVDAQSKFQLHRIEEESEADTRGSMCSGRDRESNYLPSTAIPRSISAQFEMMQQQQQREAK